MEKGQILEYLSDWNFWGDGIDTGIERSEYLPELLKSVPSREIIVLSGIRRCGKSTLLLQLLKNLTLRKNADRKNTLIIYLEDPRIGDLSGADLMKIYETYLSELKPDKDHYVVLDEVQNVNGWERFARYLSENRKINVFVTGSNSRFLSSEFSTVLSGRHIDYEVMPLSFREVLLFKGTEIKNKLELVKNSARIKETMDEYISLGGFPKAVLTSGKNEKKKILNSYYDTIIVKDICLRYRIKESAKLKELSRFYLTNISKIISMNKIKDSLGISLETVQRFSEYLESAYLIFFVPKFDYSLKKQMANPKKIYCIDSGIRNSVAFKFSDDAGRLIENTVFVELKRRKNEIYYYKTTNGLEVDFAIKKGKKIKDLIQAAENLSDFKTREREISSLIKAMKETKIKNATIITKDSEEEIKKENLKINVVPLWKWLLGERK